ncbi:hypothetical protein Nhal_1723 [Nitrosococcus halophilus Nc 4]|uniref:DUF4384 domain-containing protein n=2 Tax=Nitrosococcus halophilus TaxID=133539 RepID=D5C2I8_NITHN|nr:hypothetical protein Nhal_1723 [Nitrosococcus halophilus Nc 4]
MKTTFQFIIYKILVASATAALLSACSLNPQNVNIDLNKTLPEVKTTIFSRAVRGLGRANRIYGRGPLKIMSKPMTDNTGTSLPTSGEIPRDITEMVKSTLNSIGGGILYVPYDPEFMLNTAQTGYSEWGEKLLPNVVLVGGITEFDRGLVTKEKALDLGGTLEELDLPIALEFGDIRKNSLASITLDFNMVDFRTFTGIPFMQAVNNIKVHKGVGEDQLGFTVYGQTLGLRGNIKKIQGRHAAVRLLVQLSVLQVVGKYQKLPYWRLLPDAEPDSIVLDAVREEFYSLEEADRIAKIQEYLYLYGKPVKVTGRLDKSTLDALQAFKSKHALGNATAVSEKVYLALFENIPIEPQTQARRRQANAMIENYQQNLRDLALQETVETVAEAPREVSEPPEVQSELGTLKVWLNKSEFQIGEHLEVFFEVTKPMFVRIVSINAAGQMATLFPNPHQSDNYTLPGEVYRIPPVDAPFTLSVAAPAGLDKIRAIAATQSIPASSLPLTEEGEFDQNKKEHFAFAGAEFEVVDNALEKAMN